MPVLLLLLLVSIIMAAGGDNLRFLKFCSASSAGYLVSDNGGKNDDEDPDLFDSADADVGSSGDSREMGGKTRASSDGYGYE